MSVSHTIYMLPITMPLVFTCDYESNIMMQSQLKEVETYWGDNSFECAATAAYIRAYAGDIDWTLISG